MIRRLARVRTRLCASAGAAVVLLALPLDVVAQDTTSAAQQLGFRGVGVELPGLARIAASLAVALAIGVGGIYGLRRLFPHLAAQPGGDSPLQLGGRLMLSRTLSVYVVSVGGDTVLVAEGRSGVAVTELKHRPAGTRRDGA